MSCVENVIYDMNTTFSKKWFEFIQTLSNSGVQLNWKLISSNHNLTMELVDEHPELPWVWFHGLSRNPNLTLEFVERNLNASWDWSELSRHECMTMKFVEDHMDMPWVWGQLFHLKDFSFDFVMSHLNLRWNWESLSCCANVSLEMILENSELPWSWESIGYRSDLTPEFVDANYGKIHPLQLECNSDYQARLHGVQRDVVYYVHEAEDSDSDAEDSDFYDEYDVEDDGHYHKEINHGHENVDCEYILEHPEMDWNWKKLSNHTALSFELVLANLDKPWDWRKISGRKFRHIRKAILEKLF